MGGPSERSAPRGPDRAHEATWVGLESLCPGLVEGGYLIVDDCGLIRECHAALHDSRRENGIEPIEKIDFNGIRWRKAHSADPRAASAGEPRRASTATSTRRTNAATRTHIPTERELELERELRAVRQRLDAVSRPGGEEAE